MIIKSHIRGGYRAAAAYLKEHNKNEHIRLVQISDLCANNLDEAFHNMWAVASTTKATKPLHHISINPFKDECLTDSQVLKIIERAEQKYGYKPDCHQRVIVEHILNGRQHFHVMWNRVSLETGKAVWPGHHWNKSKQVSREMEAELGLKRPVSRRLKRTIAALANAGRQSAHFGRYQTLQLSGQLNPISSSVLFQPLKSSTKATKQSGDQNLEPVRPGKLATSTNAWPERAVTDWEAWGKHDPVRFFRLWSELVAPGFFPK